MNTKEMIEILNQTYEAILESTGGSYKKSEILQNLSKVIAELTERYESSK